MTASGSSRTTLTGLSTPRDGSSKKYIPKPRDVLPRQTCATMVQMMQGTVTDGTAANISGIAPEGSAGKTGTTNDYADAWFIGFTPELACGVWVGYDQRKTIYPNAQGGAIAAPIWAQVVRKYNPPYQREFSIPECGTGTEGPSPSENDTAEPHAPNVGTGVKVNDGF